MVLFFGGELCLFINVSSFIICVYHFFYLKWGALIFHMQSCTKGKPLNYKDQDIWSLPGLKFVDCIDKQKHEMFHHVTLYSTEI